MKLVLGESTDATVITTSSVVTIQISITRRSYDQVKGYYTSLQLINYEMLFT